MGIFRTRDERANAALTRQETDSVPPGMRIAAAWSWRVLVVAGALALVGFLLIQLRLIVVPFFVAVVVSALLVPFARWLQSKGWPKGLTVAVALVALLVVVGGLLTLVILQVRSGLPDLERHTVSRAGALTDWLNGPPFTLSDREIYGYLGDLGRGFQQGSSGLLSGALNIGSTAARVLAGALIVIFATVFILIDGRRIFGWIVGLFPRRSRRAVYGAGQAGWATLTRFVKVQIVVAFIDAVGIGLGAFIVGLIFGGFPLVLPIAVLVFLGSFIPIIGAVLTGALAVFVALIYLGPIPALIMLGVVILVQQIEGHVLQPFIMGSAVKVHPLAVVLGVAGLGFLGGIAGAFFAVPLIAMANVMIGYVARGEWRRNPFPDEQDVSTDVH